MTDDAAAYGAPLEAHGLDRQLCGYGTRSGQPGYPSYCDNYRRRGWDPAIVARDRAQPDRADPHDVTAVPGTLSGTVEPDAHSLSSPGCAGQHQPAGRALRTTKTPRAQSPGLPNGGGCAPESPRTPEAHSPCRTRFPTLLHVTLPISTDIETVPRNQFVTNPVDCLSVVYWFGERHKRSGHDQCKRLQKHIVPRRASRHIPLIPAPIHA